MVQNLNSTLPLWAKKDDKGVICVKSPREMYLAEERKSINSLRFPLVCCAGCESIFNFDYHGFDEFLSEGRGVDKSMTIFPEYTEEATVAGYRSISIDLTDKEGIELFINFIRSAQKKANKKLDLVKGISHKLHFTSGNLKVHLAIKEDGTVLLYKLSDTLANRVPDLLRPDSYSKLLGTVYHFGEDFDPKKIKEGYLFSGESILEVLFLWVEKIFRLNNQQKKRDEISLHVVKY